MTRYTRICRQCGWLADNRCHWHHRRGRPTNNACHGFISISSQTGWKNYKKAARIGEKFRTPYY